MGKNKRVLQTIIFMMVIIVAGWTIWNGLHSKKRIPMVGETAPNFSAVGIDGQIHHLADEKGNVVLINFWGSYCPPCKEEMPAIDKAYAKWKNKGFTVMGINIGESKVTVNSYIKQHHISFPIMYDERKTITDQFVVNQYPTSFFVDEKGKIVAKIEGAMDESFISQKIMQILEK